MSCMHLIGDIITPIILGERWEKERADVNTGKIRYAFLFVSPECGRVCHIGALRASICGVVSARCVCVEESLLFTELEEKRGR